MKISLKRRLARIEPRRDPEKEIREFYLHLCGCLSGDERDRLCAIAEKYKANTVIMQSDMDADGRNEMKALLVAAIPNSQ